MFEVALQSGAGAIRCASIAVFYRWWYARAAGEAPAPV
jgi:hypothetical protein